MTCGEGGPVDGLGRVLKAEATPPTAAEEPFDPRISDPNLGEHLGIPVDLENLPRQTANPQQPQPTKTKDVPKPVDTVSVGNSTAPEAKLAPAVKRSSPMMKAVTVVMFAAMSFAIGWLYTANERLDKKVDDLTGYQVQVQFGSPEALKGV